MSKILYVINDGLNYKSLQEIANSLECDFVKISVNTVFVSAAQIRHANFECIVVDADFGDPTAIKTIEHLRQSTIQQPILTYTHQLNHVFYENAIEAGAFDYLCKTQSKYKNLITLKNAIKYNALNKQYILKTANLPAVTIIDEKGKLKNFEAIDKEVLQLAYIHSKGKISELSRKLNIGRSTLYRKFEKYGIL